MKKMCVISVVALLASAAGAQVQFNEVMINPPGSPDNSNEYIELKSTAPNFDMTGLTMLIIEGDCDAGCVTGIIDQALSLDGKVTGTNSLFLWRDAANVLPGGPDPATSVFVQDISPDIENGSNTFLIVSGFTGAVGQDLDTNNDGVLDATPWATVIDALGMKDGNNRPTHFQYASQVGGLDITDNVLPEPDGFTADTFLRTCGAVLSMDLLGTIPGPFTSDPVEQAWFPALGQQLDPAYLTTPGSENMGCIVVGPSCDAIDYNGDGLFPDTADIDDFLSVFSGGVCSTGTCGDIDFNNDGLFPDTLDIDSLLSVFSGGACL
ncbi:MAG TPA: hypothetical protein VHN77_09840 [Phycisphaerales bacterium]|nr:hypothetical protein [Phycisphaerales bacterium]